jgi:hypothetical protein
VIPVQNGDAYDRDSSDDSDSNEDVIFDEYKIPVDACDVPDPLLDVPIQYKAEPKNES